MAAADRRAVGPLRRRALPLRAGAVGRRRRAGDRVVHVLHLARREPVRGGGDHGHERGDRRAPGARAACACRRWSSTASTSTCATPAATWASSCRARGSPSCPASTTCRGRATRPRVLDEIEAFLGAHADAPALPGAVLTTVLEADLPASEQRAAGLGAGALPRADARRAARPYPRGLRRPGAGRALRDRARRQLPAAARRHPHGRVRAATTARSAAPRSTSPPRSPRSPRRGRSSPPRPCRTSSRARASSSPTTAGRPASCGCSACCADRRVSRASSRGCGRRRRSGVRR